MGRYLDMLRDDSTEIRPCDKSGISDQNPPARPILSLLSLMSHPGIPEPLPMRDGRVLHRFPADMIPRAPDPTTAALVSAAQEHGAVLVGDGPTLILVEPKGSNLPRNTLARILQSADDIIAALRAEPFPRGRIITVYDGSVGGAGRA